jgi:hypothetical protein
VIASKRASARRSRFCAVTYSTACQRVTRLMRLPTLALPATAPSFRIGEPARQPRDRRRLELGIGIERDDDLARGQLPARSLSARALPPFSSVSSRTRGSSAKASCTIALVSSFDPSSITITSIRTSVLASTRRTEALDHPRLVEAGISTETKRAGSIAGGTARLRLSVGSHREDREQDRAQDADEDRERRTGISARSRRARQQRNRSTSKRTAISSEPLIGGIHLRRGVSPASCDTGTNV